MMTWKRKGGQKIHIGVYWRTNNKNNSEDLIMNGRKVGEVGVILCSRPRDYYAALYRGNEARCRGLS